MHTWLTWAFVVYFNTLWTVKSGTKREKKRGLLFNFLTASFCITFFFHIAYRYAWFQRNRIGCDKKAKKRTIFNVQKWTIFSRDWRSNIFIFVKIMKIAAICFWCIEFMPKISTFIFFEIAKNWKIFDRQSLVNVTLKIRTKFHSNRLVRFRDILHTVSKNLTSRKTRSKNVTFHMYHLLTLFTFISRLTVLTIHN